MRSRITLLLVPILCAAALAQEDTFDWLVKEHAATRPSTRPAAARSSPTTRPIPSDAIAGAITLSDGSRISGPISTTPQKPLRVWVEAEHQYVDLRLAEIRSLAASVPWERDEKEWHFIASGSDVKEYTGRTYPARETMYTFFLRDGRQITGSIVAPIYVYSEEGPITFVLHKRDKGDFGKTLADLKYIKSIEFTGDNTP